MHRSVLLHAIAVLACAAPAWAAEPVDVGAPRLRMSTTLAAPPAQPGSHAPTFTQRTQQPAAVLRAEGEAREHELLQAMQSAASQQRTLDDLEARLARARAERDMNPLIATLMLLLVATTAGAAAFWWKLRRRPVPPLAAGPTA